MSQNQNNGRQTFFPSQHSMTKWNIEEKINRYVPAPRYERWPRLVAHFLGYRQSKDHPKPAHELVVLWWITLTSFTGMIVLMVTFKYGAKFQEKQVPEIVPSWAASAILMFNVVESPLGQPRNAFGGTMISSLVGVCIMKLFMTNSDNEQYLWISGALSVAVSSACMRFVRMVHPPAGAAALLPSVQNSIRALGWYYLLVQLLSSALMIAVACIFNNIQRRYPLYWWTPLELSAPKVTPDEEKKPQEETTTSTSTPDRYEGPAIGEDLHPIRTSISHRSTKEPKITISSSNWHLPEGIQLTPEEERVLEGLQLQLSNQLITTVYDN